MKVTFPRIFRRSLAFIACAFSLFLIQGCATDHSYTGTITVDHPEVFTRERLINRRLEEQQWLENQLKVDAAPSLQGSIDTREFIGLAAAVKGNFDPFAGTQAQSAIQNIQENSRINDLQSQLQTEILKKQIQLVQDWTNANVPTPTLTNLSAVPFSDSNTAPVAVGMGPFTTNVPSLPNPSNRVVSGSSLTSVETLDDKLAYRNAIQSLLRDQELDDTHDLGGMTLYTLKFDISVLPGENNPSFGKVSINISEPKSNQILSNKVATIYVTNDVTITNTQYQYTVLRGALNNAYLTTALPDFTPGGHLPITNKVQIQKHKPVIISYQETNYITLYNCLPTRKEYEGWIKNLDTELVEECMEVERRYYMGYLSDQEKDDLFESAIEQIGDLTDTIKYTSMDALDPLGSDRDAIMTNAAIVSANIPHSKTPQWIAFAETFTNAIQNYIKNDCPQSETNLNDAFDELYNNFYDLDQAFYTNGDYYSYYSDAKWSYLSGQRKSLSSLQSLLQELNTGPSANGAGARALAYLVQQGYKTALSNYVNFPDINDTVYQVDSKPFFICSAEVNTNDSGITGYQGFINALAQLKSDWSPHVAVVEPKQYAQNISDVAAWDRVVSLAASLSALVPQASTTLGFDSSFVKHSQQMLDTIKRQPLLVSYADGDTNFGWFLGPRFAIQNLSAQRFQTPVQYSVEASIVVPGWWSEVNLDVVNSWMNDNMHQIKIAGSENMNVRLPRDYSSITRALLEQSDQSLLKPSIAPRWDTDALRQHFVVREGRNESLLIRGSDLWRNPKVFIGSQAADTVYVLPDMNGVVAQFNDVQLPSSTGSGPQLSDLSVVTSGGISTLRDGVEILPDQNTRTATFASLQNLYLTNGGSLVFNIDPNKAPHSYGQLRVVINDPRDSSQILDQTVASNFPSGGAWQFPISAGTILKDSRHIQVDLRMGQTPDPKEILVSVLDSAPKQIVFFDSPADLQFAAVPNPATNAFTLSLPPTTDTNLFNEVFPGFVGALNNGTVVMTMTSGPLSVTNHLQGTLSDIPVKNLPIKTNLNWSIKLSDPQSNNSFLVGSNLTFVIQ